MCVCRHHPYPLAAVLGSTLLSLNRKDLLNVPSTSLMKGLPAMKQRTTSDSNLLKSNIGLVLLGFTTATETEGSSEAMGRYRLRIMLRSLSFDRSWRLSKKSASAGENSLTSTVSGADCSQQVKEASLPWLATIWTRLLWAEICKGGCHFATYCTVLYSTTHTAL